MAKIEWHGNEFNEELEQSLAKNIEAAAIYFKEKVKRAIGVTGNPYRYAIGAKGPWYRNENPSAPGYPPHKMLGDLQRSIAHEMSEDKQTAFVGTNLEYGYYLEVGTRKMEARPYLRSTLEKEQATIAKIVATGKAA
jgi:phage gpG-like protein